APCLALAGHGCTTSPQLPGPETWCRPGRFGITVNCIHPSITRIERRPGLLEARARHWGITPEEVEAEDFAPNAHSGNSLCRMVDASEMAYLTSFLASDKAWAVTGELVVATGGAGTSVYY
ncbi:MAG: hypothetical protein O3A33_07585, partial [Chloroflexi bacterium]|nr:hypothetical protein [Chloroflexota bacterium]